MRDRKILTCGLIWLALTSTPAIADEEAANIPRVFTDDWGRCYAKSVPNSNWGQEGTTQVYSVEKGADRLLGEYNWYSARIELLCHTCSKGECGHVIIRHGPWARGHEPNENDLALAFYLNGKLKKRYSTLDIIGDGSKAQKSVSHYKVVKEYKGFTHTQKGQPRYTIMTHAGEEIVFDPATGQRIVPLQNSAADQALFKAIRDKNIMAIDAALKNGADINSRIADEYDWQYTWTPLILAYQTRDQKLIAHLLAKGADINARTHRGETVLSQAIQSGDRDNLEFLLDHGADANGPTAYFGERPLHLLARSYDGVSMADILLKHGADINATDENGHPPLFSAAAGFNDTKLLLWMLEHGANIHQTSKNGDTALHQAARYATQEHVKILLEHGADPKHVNDEGKTALDYAIHRGDKGVINLLQKAE